MNLYKRGRIWWVKYQVDGKVHRKSTRTGKYSEAESWLKAIRTASKMPTFEEAVDVLRMLYKKPVEGMVDMDDAWEKYEQLARAVGKLQVKEKTLIDRRNHLRRFAEWLKEEAATIRTVDAVSGAIAAKYAEHLAQMGLTTKTRATTIGNLSLVWKMLEKVSPKIRNPWTNLAPADTDRKRLPAFSPEQEELVLAAAKTIGKDWWSVCTIARHTGLRYGDIATMKWCEIDLAQGIIHRKPSKTEKYGIAVTLPITQPIREALEASEGFADHGNGDGWVFPLHGALYGRRGKNVQALLSFREVLDEAEIDEDYTFHSWRHTAATRLAASGVGVETRKRILGHTRDDTAERYDHDEHIEEMRAAMEAAGRQKRVPSA